MLRLRFIYSCLSYTVEQRFRFRSISNEDCFNLGRVPVILPPGKAPI